MGDDVQAIKHGILEIADVLVVNKGDREGADRTVRDLRAMLGLRTIGPQEIDIVQTVATRGEGIDELWQAIDRHRTRQQASGAFIERRRMQAEEQLRAVVTERLRRAAEDQIARLGGISALADEVAARRRDPYSVAEEITGPGSS
jgi:LAO/AO transport system kinase